MDGETEKIEVLFERITRGDVKAEALLIAKFSQPVRLILLRRIGDPLVADDLIQDTFLIALNRIRAGDIRNRTAIGAFIRQTAINLSIEYFRKEKRYIRPDDGIISLHAPHTDNKAQRMDRQRARKLLEGALEQLSQPRDREILLRFYLLDEDKTQICSALDLTPAHFDRVLYRAKQRMRALLRDNTELKALLFGGLSDG